MGERDEQAKARFDRGLPVDDESGDSNIGCSKTKNNTDPTYIVSTCSGSLELEQPNTIQLVPGVNLVLRGAEETMQAIGNDFYVATHCFDCQAMLFCIRNAGFLVCPHCRVVSPVESNENTNEHFALSKNNGNICGSVGLGFTLDELCEYQTMIVSARMADTVVCEE